MRILIILCVFILSGCAHFREPEQRSVFQDNAKAAVDGTPWEYTQPENFRLLLKCKSLKLTKREKCFEDGKRTIQAKIIMNYPNANKSEIETYYYAKKDNFIPTTRAKMKAASKKLSDDQLDAFAELDTYELIARASQMYETSESDYRSNVANTNAYNSAESQRVQSISRAFTDVSNESRLDRLENNYSSKPRSVPTGSRVQVQNQ